MFFQIDKLILWPRNAAPRVLQFTGGVVNVISGLSKKGKSAVIPIVDYCLGADKCAIPVGVIRQACSWFGIIINTVEGQKLIARREPGDQQSTSDMILIEAPVVEVPEKIGAKNTNALSVKGMLDRLAGLTNLGFEPGSESAFKARPSFRDLMAFTFQPQNIVANPNVMFFKADTTEHREKLKTIFPYVLGAITADLLQARYDLDRLHRLLRRKETELRTLTATTSAWQQEAQTWIRQAIELGLLPSDQLIPLDWPEMVGVLRRAAATNARDATPSIDGLDLVLARLQVLRADEAMAAERLTECRQRINELRRLLESSEAYSGAIRAQRDRLAIADWLRSLDQDIDDPLVALGDGDRQQLAVLCDALDGLELQLRTHPSMTNTLDREMQRLRGDAETILARLHEIRQEIAVLERQSEAAHAEVDRFYRVERFIGRLVQALELYDRVDESAELRAEISDLQAQIRELSARVSERDIERRTRNALERIQGIAGSLIPQLDAEWPSAPIRLVIDDLTIQVLQGRRDDYLWEIGSGANWLAYHVAVTLALQLFFLKEAHAPVPHLLVYDQPSQVYFPQRAVDRGDDESEPEWKDQDIEAVRKVFTLLGKEAVAARGLLQVIVLDHADEAVWGSLDGVQLVERWRDIALVPDAWIVPAG
jgi:hypothetical protein